MESFIDAVCCFTIIHFDIDLFSLGISSWLKGKASACNVGDLGLIPGPGRSPGEGNGNPLQYSCLKNSMGYNPWGCKQSDTTERLHFHFH